MVVSKDKKLVIVVVGIVIVLFVVVAVMNARRLNTANEAATATPANNYPAEFQASSEVPGYTAIISNMEHYFNSVIPLQIYGRNFELQPQGSTEDEPVQKIIIRLVGARAITSIDSETTDLGAGYKVTPGTVEVYVKVPEENELTAEEMAREVENLTIKALYFVAQPNGTNEQAESVVNSAQKDFITIERQETK